MSNIQHLGMSDGKYILKINGVRWALTESEYEAFEKTGALPARNDEAANAPKSLDARLTAIEKQLAGFGTIDEANLAELVECEPYGERLDAIEKRLDAIEDKLTEKPEEKPRAEDKPKPEEKPKADAK